jgi:hypothetical protein
MKRTAIISSILILIFVVAIIIKAYYKKYFCVYVGKWVCDKPLRGV